MDQSSAPSDARPDVTVHLSPVERFVASPLFLLVFVSIGAPQFASRDGALPGTALILIGVVGCWMGVVRVRVELGSEGLVVHNPVRTRRLRLVDIDAVDPAYEGLKLHLKNGQVVTVVAVQRWNVSLWLDRRTRSDRIADEIRSRMAAVA